MEAATNSGVVVSFGTPCCYYLGKQYQSTWIALPLLKSGLPDIKTCNNFNNGKHNHTKEL